MNDFHRMIIGAFVALVLVLSVRTVFTSKSEPLQKSKPMFEVGDIVEHKLTHERGIVMICSGDTYLVRLQDLKKERFNEFELSLASSETVLEPPPVMMDPPQGERTWNPVTERYE